MTFLQPFILWGLPLILVPVVIHFINRMRHRTLPWAAMQFLFSANRSSVRHARLRQFLILLFRVLAVLMLILFLSRPLAGGWLGWAVASAPDTIVLILDRSASMEARVAGGTETRRAQALRLFAQGAGPFQGTSHLVLVDSASRQPQEIADAEVLSKLKQVGATDTAADIPGLLQQALRWLTDNRAGNAEIWIASDLQRSNWHPQDPRWQQLRAQVAALPQTIRVRLLDLSGAAHGDASVSLEEAVRRPGGVDLAFQIERTGSSRKTLSASLNLSGHSIQVSLPMESSRLVWRRFVPLKDEEGKGWGRLELPVDANPRNNSAWFVYGAETPVQAVVVTANAARARRLILAAARFRGKTMSPAEVKSPEEFQAANWDADTLVVWDAPLPGEALGERLRSFAAGGGEVVFFPPGNPGAGRMAGLGWGEVEQAAADEPFRVLHWEETQGPLAKTQEGFSLPLDEVTFRRRQDLTGKPNTVAAFADGTAFLAHQSFGQGDIYFCTSFPVPEWSDLGEGTVLVPMLQRLLEAGGRRLQGADHWVCGELSLAELERNWRPVGGEGGKDIRTQAGVYRAGDHWVAVNRPAAEDDPTVLPMDVARSLFGRIPFQSFRQTGRTTNAMQGEIWRVLLVGMLGFLLVEGWLLLPRAEAEEPAAGWQGEGGKTA